MKQHQNNEASKQDIPSENRAFSKYKSKLNVYRAWTVNIGFWVVTAMKFHTSFVFQVNDIIQSSVEADTVSIFRAEPTYQTA
jgi:hypothetical protein